MVTGLHEQTCSPRLQDLELAGLQRGAQAARLADDPLADRRLPAIAVRLVRSRHDLGLRRQADAADILTAMTQPSSLRRAQMP